MKGKGPRGGVRTKGKQEKEKCVKKEDLSRGKGSRKRKRWGGLPVGNRARGRFGREEKKKNPLGKGEHNREKKRRIRGQDAGRPPSETKRKEREG